MALTTGRKLARAWRELRENQPQAGPGWLSRGGPRGQTFHQQVFCVGVPLPDEEVWEQMTAEERLPYYVVNTHKADMLSGYPSNCGMSATPASALPALSWGRGPKLVSKRTRQRFAAASAQSGLGMQDGMQASGRPRGCVAVKSPGETAPGSVINRAAIPPRLGRAHGAEMVRSHRPTPVSAGSGLMSRQTPGGKVLSGYTSSLPEVLIGLVDEAEVSVVGVGAVAIVEWIDEPEDVLAEYEIVGTGLWEGRSGPRLAVPARAQGRLIRPMGFGVTLRHETPDIDELVTYSHAPSAVGVDLDDPTTWTKVGKLEMRANETQYFERYTVVHVWWATV